MAVTTHRIPRSVDDVHAVNLARSSGWTIGLGTATLIVNLVTGVLIARILGTTGRGELTAIIQPAVLLGFAFGLGCLQAANYHQARHPQEGAQLIGTWLLILAPISVVALVAGEAMLPSILAAQSSATLHLAQILMLTVIVQIFNDLFSGFLLGDHDFVFVNLARFGQPAITAATYIVLWRLHWFSVRTALIGLAVPGLIITALLAGRALARHSIARPSLKLARSSLWYGVRAHGARVSELLNLRLDLLIITAFLGASTVGLYAVATTVSEIVVTIAGAVSLLVLPISARQGPSGVPTVLRFARMAFLLAVLLALAIGVLAGPAINIVYGKVFSDSAPLVRLLLPGAVMYAGARVLMPALAGMNRPFTATLASSLGVLVTLPGLILFLPHGGLVAASLVSTASYSAVFLAALVLYTRRSKLPLLCLLDWSEIRADLANLRPHSLQRNRSGGVETINAQTDDPAISLHAGIVLAQAKGEATADPDSSPLAHG